MFPFLIGIVVGVILGVVLGLLIASLCVAAKDGSAVEICEPVFEPPPSARARMADEQEELDAAIRMQTAMHRRADEVPIRRTNLERSPKFATGKVDRIG